MKRFVSIIGLALGVSVSSFAGLVNNSGSSTSGTNLGSPGAALIDFEAGAYPLGAFSSLPFSITAGSGTFTGTLTWANAGAPCATTGGSSGVTIDANSNNCGSVQNFGGAQGKGISTAEYGTSSQGSSTSYGTTLRLTFTSGNVSEFSTFLRFNDSTTTGGAFNPALNYMLVNFTGGGNSGNQNLPSQVPGNGNTFGWTVNTPGQTISFVDFVITGHDFNGALPTDILVFDDLRIFGAGGGATTTGGGGGTTTGGGGGAIPEPSTYALMGAGLAALAYARRRR